MDWQRFQLIVSEQDRRNFDKYALAPFLIYTGIKFKGLPKMVRRVLVTAGIFQIYYSWNNYMKLQQKLTEAVVEKKNPFAPIGQ